MKVGYPKSLLFYKYFPLWETFFSRLGAKVEYSVSTNKKLITKATALAENELCLPVKVFFGHVLDLKEKVDCLFIPRYVSVEKTAYTCPKFLGLPDLTRATDQSLPPILEPVINFKKGWRYYRQTVEELGSYFTKSKVKIWLAYWQGVQALKKYYHYLLSGHTPVEYLNSQQQEASSLPLTVDTPSLTIGVIGHPYNIYDYYISLNLIPRLKRLGAKVVTSEMVPHHLIEKEAQNLPKQLFWTYERELVGTAFHLARSQQVDGLIYVLSFACGPDSLIQVLLEHELKKFSSVPMMSLVIDEHSGEAGMVTRIEAFVDMLKRKKLLAGKTGFQEV